MSRLTEAIRRKVKRLRQWMSGKGKPARWQLAYGDKAPWDIGRPQQVVVQSVARITGSVLEVGCGTGENALYLASQGRAVTGVDFVSDAVEQAREKASQRGLTATFRVGDATALRDMKESFDNAIDIGLFHILTPDRQRLYIEGLATVLKPGGRLFLLGFSDLEPLPQTHAATRPQRITHRHLHEMFAQGWEIESIEPARFELRSDFSSKEGSARAWFAVIRRQAM